MGVYIKGIEMPIGGRILIVFPSGRVSEVSADATQNIFRETQAVPILPHGRLGDLDALENIVFESLKNAITDCNPTLFGKVLCTFIAESIVDEIEAAPTIIPAEESDMDTEEIVRCKDCEHWETSWTPRGVSDGRHYCAPLDLFPSADWFCADGEKREES